MDRGTAEPKSFVPAAAECSPELENFRSHLKSLMSSKATRLRAYLLRKRSCTLSVRPARATRATKKIRFDVALEPVHVCGAGRLRAPSGTRRGTVYLVSMKMSVLLLPVGLDFLGKSVCCLVEIFVNRKL